MQDSKNASVGPACNYKALPESERFIGGGNFGSVKKVQRTSDLKILACKSIRYRDSETSEETAGRECAILKELDHPNVIKLVDIEWLPHKAKIYMEYCEGGSLQHLIDEYKVRKTHTSELYVWSILLQLASALLYCHYGAVAGIDGQVSFHQQDWKQVLHRDIKPANVFLFNRSDTVLDAVRLGDFGLGYILKRNEAPDTYVGTAQYMAPEINRHSSRQIHWTEHCDIFSLGCTVYALCTLKPPFDYHMECELDTYSPLPSYYSEELRDCIASCLSFHPQVRPSALRLFLQIQQHVNRIGLIAVSPRRFDHAETREIQSSGPSIDGDVQSSTSQELKDQKSDQKKLPNFQSSKRSDVTDKSTFTNSAYVRYMTVSMRLNDFLIAEFKPSRPMTQEARQANLAQLYQCVRTLNLGERPPNDPAPIMAKDKWRPDLTITASDKPLAQVPLPSSKQRSRLERSPKRSSGTVPLRSSAELAQTILSTVSNGSMVDDKAGNTTSMIVDGGLRPLIGTPGDENGDVLDQSSNSRDYFEPHEERKDVVAERKSVTQRGFVDVPSKDLISKMFKEKAKRNLKAPNLVDTDPLPPTPSPAPSETPAKSKDAISRIHPIIDSWQSDDLAAQSHDTKPSSPRAELTRKWPTFLTPFAGLEGLIVVKNRIVEDSSGNTVGIVVVGDLERLIGCAVDEHGFIINRIGFTTIKGRVKRY